MLILGTEKKNATAVKQVVTLSTSPLCAVLTAFVLFLILWEGLFSPLHWNYRIPHSFIMTSHKRETIITNDSEMSVFRAFFLFFVAYCVWPVSPSRKPFTNSFSLFPGLPFISAFIRSSPPPSHPGSLYFVSSCFWMNNEFCGSGGTARPRYNRDTHNRTLPATIHATYRWGHCALCFSLSYTDSTSLTLFKTTPYSLVDR
jgi:hypothetical protein